MDYTGMLHPKGVPFSSLRYAEKESLFRERYVNGAVNLRNLVCERVPIFQKFNM